jgi:hypothetical protein
MTGQTVAITVLVSARGQHLLIEREGGKCHG